MAITWDLQMIESWFWYQTSCFGMNFLKKISKTFFGLKKFIFWPRGGHFGYPQPSSTMKFEISTPLLQFHINSTSESAKKKWQNLLSRLQNYSKITYTAVFLQFWRFFGIFGHFQPPEQCNFKIFASQCADLIHVP